MKVKEESEKFGLKLNIQKTKIMASGPITSWEIDGETVETVSDFIFWMLSFKSVFSLSHFHQEALYFLFSFSCKGGVICISEFIDISLGSLDSRLCFIQPGISHDVLCIEVK